MKRTTRLTVLLLTIFIVVSFSNKPKKSVNIKKTSELSRNITISGAFALYPITVKWAEDFKKIHPGVNIDVQAGGAGKGITDVLAKVTDIGLVSRDLNQEELTKNAYPIAVARDAVVPTISAKSPFVKVLYKRGIKRSMLNALYITGQVKEWGSVGFVSKAPVHIYTRSDAAGAADTWAKYFGKKQENLLGIAVYGDPGVALAVKKDRLGIGFNNIVYVYDAKTGEPTNGVVPIPIDTNENGQIDAGENFYANINDFTTAVAEGRYPSPPARNLYFVTSGKSKNPLIKEFMKYVLTDGQKIVHEQGYINLDKIKLKTELGKL